MYGVVFQFLQEFVINNQDEQTWSTLLEKSGIGHKVYFSMVEYPDDEAIKLILTAADMLNLPPITLLEAFGEDIGPKLLSNYHFYIEKGWRTVEILKYIQNNIHQMLVNGNNRRKPPTIHLYDVPDQPDTYELVYQSHRRLCPVVKGIITGLCNHFDDQFDVKEHQCMHQGHLDCRFYLTQQGSNRVHVA